MTPSLNLLIVEDNDDHADIVTRLLKDVSWISWHRESLLSVARKTLVNGKYDALLLDLSLPDSNYEETLQFITDHSDELPIIVLTSLDDTNLARSLLKCGAQDYLTKSFLSTDLVVKSIRYSLERKVLQRELKQKSVELEKKNVFLEKLVIERTERLSKSEQKYRSLVNLSPISVVICDEDGQVSFTNREFHRVFGYKKEFKLDNIFRLFSDKENNAVDDIYRGFKVGVTQTTRRNVELIKKSGEVIFAQITVTQLPTTSKAEAVERKQYLLLIDDVTESIRQEKVKQQKHVAEKANQAKTDFLTHISHEIRTPLTAITGYVDLLISRNRDIYADRFLQSLRRNSQHLLLLVNDLLDLSKIESGQLDITPLEFSLVDEIDAILEMVEPLIMDRAVVVRANYRGFMPQKVCLDIQKFRQILLNLINNSIKYTEHGFIEVSVRVNVGSNDTHGTLRIEVSDTGKGIAPDLADKLFLPFTRGKDREVLKKEGIGVGLALSKKLALALGGDLELQSSEVDKGTTFLITLPLGNLENVAFFRPENTHTRSRQLSEDQLNELTVSLTGKRILVAEDVDDIQILIDTILKRFGAEVTLVADGVEALALMAKQNYDLVLMDIQMPKMDGVATVKEARNRGYSGKVLALTAHAFREERDRCVEAGFDGFIAKPFSEHSLMDTILSQITDMDMPADGNSAAASESNGKSIDPEALDMFVNNLNKNVNELKDSLAKNNFEQMGKIAHKIKGSAGCYSFSDLSDLAKSLESQLSNVESEIQKEKVNDLVHLIEKKKNQINSVEPGGSSLKSPYVRY